MITKEKVYQDCVDHVNDNKSIDWIVNNPYLRYLPKESNIGKFDGYIANYSKYNPESVKQMIDSLKNYLKNLEVYHEFISNNDLRTLEESIRKAVKEGVIEFLINYYEFENHSVEVKQVLEHQVKSEHLSIMEIKDRFENYYNLFIKNKKKKQQ